MFVRYRKMAASTVNAVLFRRLVNYINYASRPTHRCLSVRCRHPLTQRVGIARHMCSSKTDDGDSDVPQTSNGSDKLDLAKPRAKQRAEKLQAAAEANPEAEGLEADLVTAVKDVADSLPGDTGQTTSELLRKLQEHVVLTSDQKHGQVKKSVSDLFTGLKVEKRRRRGAIPDADGETDSSESRYRKPRRTDRRSISETMLGSRGAPSRPVKIDLKLYGGEALGIFNDLKPAEVSTEIARKPRLFEQIELENLAKLSDLPVPNAFEESIRWTKQGILWKFPVDNEQGLEKEAEVGFHEHVFLDHLIEDFPARGPLRHFMELVTTGLSKNAYLTVEQKAEHVQWFRDYFADKIHIVEEATRIEATA